MFSWGIVGPRLLLNLVIANISAICHSYSGSKDYKILIVVLFVVHVSLGSRKHTVSQIVPFACSIDLKEELCSLGQVRKSIRVRTIEY